MRLLMQIYFILFDVIKCNEIKKRHSKLMNGASEFILQKIRIRGSLQFPEELFLPCIPT